MHVDSRRITPSCTRITNTGNVITTVTTKFKHFIKLDIQRAKILRFKADL